MIYVINIFLGFILALPLSYFSFTNLSIYKDKLSVVCYILTCIIYVAGICTIAQIINTLFF